MFRPFAPHKYVFSTRRPLKRQEAERLVAESERKHAEEKKAYEKALLAADEARRTGRRRG